MDKLKARIEEFRVRGLPAPLTELAAKVSSHWGDSPEQAKELIEELKPLPVEQQREIFRMWKGAKWIK